MLQQIQGFAKEHLWLSNPECLPGISHEFGRGLHGAPQDLDAFHLSLLETLVMLNSCPWSDSEIEVLDTLLRKKYETH